MLIPHRECYKTNSIFEVTDKMLENGSRTINNLVPQVDILLLKKIPLTCFNITFFLWKLNELYATCKDLISILRTIIMRQYYPPYFIYFWIRPCMLDRRYLIYFLQFLRRLRLHFMGICMKRNGKWYFREFWYVMNGTIVNFLRYNRTIAIWLNSF